MRKILLIAALTLPAAAWPVHSKIQVGPHPDLVISGHVLGPDGKPMSGVAMHVVLSQYDGWLRTANDGSYEIDTVAPDGPQIRFDFQAPGMQKQSQTLAVRKGVSHVEYEPVLHR
jgi:hypothetical protein